MLEGQEGEEVQEKLITSVSFYRSVKNTVTHMAVRKDTVLLYLSLRPPAVWFLDEQ